MPAPSPPLWRPDIHADRRPALMARGRIKAALRRWLEARDFVEVETPTLTRSTPEGARDFLVPARLLGARAGGQFGVGHIVQRIDADGDEAAAEFGQIAPGEQARAAAAAEMRRACHVSISFPSPHPAC